MSRARRAFGTTTAILGSFFRGASSGITTYLAYEDIHNQANTNALTPNSAADNTQSKARFSGPYALACTTNSINVSIELYNFLTHIIASGAWQNMTVAERLSIGVLVATGAVSTGYSFWRIAASPDLIASGVASATGLALFSLANTVTNHAVRRQMCESGESEYLLNRIDRY